MWDKPDADWRLGRTYKLIHDLAPSAMVGSNHHIKPFPGEDFQMFEKGLPGKGPWDKGGISSLPLVITSYSIHYTKLYERMDQGVGLVQPPVGVGFIPHPVKPDATDLPVLCKQFGIV